MEKLVFMLFCSVMLLNSSPASAFVFEGLPFTGKTANRDETIGFQGAGSTGLGPIGGQAHNNNRGYAAQFILGEPTYLSKVSFDMRINSLGNIDTNIPVNFNFHLYQGDSFYGPPPVNLNQPIPNVGNLLFTSDPVILGFDIERVRPDGSFVYTETRDYFGLERDINTTLNPGTYWLSYENEGGGGHGTFLTGNIEAAPVPEPTSMLLLGGGLVGMLWRRRSSR